MLASANARTRSSVHSFVHSFDVRISVLGVLVVKVLGISVGLACSFWFLLRVWRRCSYVYFSYCFERANHKRQARGWDAVWFAGALSFRKIDAAGWPLGSWSCLDDALSLSHGLLERWVGSFHTAIALGRRHFVCCHAGCWASKRTLSHHALCNARLSWMGGVNEWAWFLSISSRYHKAQDVRYLFACCAINATYSSTIIPCVDFVLHYWH